MSPRSVLPSRFIVAAVLAVASAQVAQPVVFADSTSTGLDGYYTIGYINASLPGVNGTSPMCHRIGALAFTAAASGTVQSMSLAVLPGPSTEACEATIWLYTAAGVAVGGSQLVAFSALAGSTPYQSAISVAAASWQLTAGTSYYMTLQTFTWDNATPANHCSLTLPWGGTAGASWSVLVQRGPVGQPCGATPWATDASRPGGAFFLHLAGTSAIAPSAAITPAVTPSPAATSGSTPVVFADSITPAYPISGNYTLGYANFTVAGVAGTNAMCHRVSLWKFAAQASGIVTSLSMTVFPGPSTEMCTATFWLYRFGAGTQVGASTPVTFSALASTAATEATTMDVSAAAWTLTAGQLYYFVFQTFTWDDFGNHCAITAPYTTAAGVPWAVVTDRGPVNTPCGGSPVTTDMALDGGAFLTRLTGVALPGAASVTGTPSGSAAATPTNSAGISPSATAAATLSPGATPTPVATPPSTPAASAAATPAATTPAAASPSASPASAPGASPSAAASVTPAAVAPSASPAASSTASPASTVVAPAVTAGAAPTPSVSAGASPSVSPSVGASPVNGAAPTSPAGAPVAGGSSLSVGTEVAIIVSVIAVVALAIMAAYVIVLSRRVEAAILITSKPPAAGGGSQRGLPVSGGGGSGEEPALWAPVPGDAASGGGLLVAQNSMRNPLAVTGPRVSQRAVYAGGGV